MGCYGLSVCSLHKNCGPLVQHPTEKALEALPTLLQLVYTNFHCVGLEVPDQLHPICYECMESLNPMQWRRVVELV